jgi:hypothetical protein
MRKGRETRSNRIGLCNCLVYYTEHKLSVIVLLLLLLLLTSPTNLCNTFSMSTHVELPRETWHANCGESNSELLLKLLQIGNCSWRLQATSWVFSCVWGFLQNKPADQKLKALCDDIFKCELWWWLTHLNCDPTFSPWNVSGCVILVLFTLVARLQQYGSGAL